MKVVYRAIACVLLFVWISTPHMINANSNTSNALDLKNDEFETFMEKIRVSFALNPKIDPLLDKYDKTQGCFIDVDYGRQDRTNWEPIIHIIRLYDFVFAYTHPKNVYYQNEELYHHIVKGLEYWYKRNPHSNNWWYNQIGEPQKLGILLIQMRMGKKQIPGALEAQTLQRILKDGGHPVKWTGANRTDIALHWIYRACLEKNDTDLKIALENVFSPVEYTVKEGFQHDNSYFQHGVQLYIGGYGDEILKGITQVAMYAIGTQYTLSPEKLKLLSKFMRQTYYPVIRGQYMLFDVLGRGVSRLDMTKKSSTALFAQRMVELDPAHADEYRTIIARLEGKQSAGYGVKPLHTHYFRGDYTLHVRPGYTFDVRLASNRTMRCEYGNGENLKAYFMSDGCTNIVIQGDEYAGIFPVWNWTRIPGVTAPQLDVIPMAASEWQTRGTSTFAGGVSDSIYGVSTYSYMDTHSGINTGAKKAWFFFDDEVVCLGAGISSTSRVPVYTTINQCQLSKEGVALSQQQQQQFKLGKFAYDSPDWVLHRGIGYVFPKGGHVFLNNLVQSGAWYDINRTQSKMMQQQEVFTLGFNHGIAPQQDTYAYIIVPGIDSPSKMRAYPKDQIEILTNTESMQIVRHKKLRIWQMVFYREGTFKHKDIVVKVDKGCTLMLKSIGRQMELHIADPAQTESSIRIDVTIPKQSQKTKTVLCNFEQMGIYAGASKAYKL